MSEIMIISAQLAVISIQIVFIHAAISKKCGAA